MTKLQPENTERPVDLEKTEEEISDEGRAAIRLWQQAYDSDGATRFNYLQQFHAALHRICDPSTKILSNSDEEHLVRVLIEGDGQYLYIFAGSAGERIMFRSVDTEARARGEEIATLDSRVGWMLYRKPSGDVGMTFWENYIRHFGKEQVNLRQIL